MRSDTGEERESSTQRGWTVEGRGAESAPASPAIEPEGSAAGVGETRDAERGELAGEADALGGAGRTQMSNLTVVMLGVVGGISMLYAWVWMSWAQYYAVVNTSVAASSGSIGGVLQQVAFWIAPLAPVLWFVAALALERRNQRRLTLALVIGLVVTFPLPMVLASGAAL